MLHYLRVFSVAALVASALNASAAPGDVVSALPTPGPAPTGLAFDGQRLWVADRTTDSLYAIDPASGRVVRTLAAPGFITLGLAWDGKHLWCVDGEERRINCLNTETGVTVKTIDAPTARPTGLCWDGAYLWLADESDDVLCRLSPADGTTIRTFPAPSGAATGLAWWNGYVWCSDRRDDRIYLFDPEHGEVVFEMPAPGLHVRDLTSDGEYLWCADYQSDSLFKLIIDDNEPLRTSNPKALRLGLEYEFRNYGPGTVPDLNVYIAVPTALISQRLLHAPRFTPQPTAYITDQWEQPVAHFHFTDTTATRWLRIRMDAAVELSDERRYIYPHKVGKLADIPDAVRKPYLIDAEKYRITDPIIQTAVKEAVGQETNPYWMMRAIHKYIRDRLHYELAGGWNVAPQVLERGNGSCSEYTFVFIAMCRAAGIPARYVGSVVVRGDDASTDDVFHRWSQVYLPGYGWIHVDPQGGDKPGPADVAASIGTVDNRFLITTAGGGGSDYLDWGYNYNVQWQSRGPVKVYSEAAGEWSPIDAAAYSQTESGTLQSGQTCDPVAR